MKKTLLFSNIIGDVCSDENQNLRFNLYMEEYLKQNVDSTFNLVFINAPGLGGEENYLKNILKCFENIGISFRSILDIEENTRKIEVDEFIKNNDRIIYFLMGGNPIKQIEIIDRLNLRTIIKNHNELVIGFCAGAINLSKYSVITTDEDFDKTQSYIGVERVSIIVEPHYNLPIDENRNDELLSFSKQYNSKIYAIPDESIIIVEDNYIIEYGKIYYIEY